jgi:hypothetical protein
MESWIEIERLPEVSGFARREVERTAWRAIVRRRLGLVEIGYNRNGAPILGPGGPGRPGGPGAGHDAGAGPGTGPGTDPNAGLGYISISHTKGWVAVIWSPEPCAVDIERRDRALSADAAARYGITSIEEWCALEARYKFAGLTTAEPPPVRFHTHPDLVVAVIL